MAIEFRNLTVYSLIFRLPARMTPVGRADCRLKIADLKMQRIIRFAILSNSNLRHEIVTKLIILIPYETSIKRIIIFFTQGNDYSFNAVPCDH